MKFKTTFEAIPNDQRPAVRTHEYEHTSQMIAQVQRSLDASSFGPELGKGESIKIERIA